MNHLIGESPGLHSDNSDSHLRKPEHHQEFDKALKIIDSGHASISFARGQSLRTYNLYMVNLVCLDHSFYQVIEHRSFALRPVEAITEFI
jgi:hypothetical protein